MVFTVNSFVYFAFGNIYSSNILNFKDFSTQFHSGIYQYRILSALFLTWVYDALGSFNIDFEIFKLKFLNPTAEPRMYLSFYILNTFFTALCAVMMVLISETKYFTATKSEKLLIIFLGISVVALTQFVILPYDCSSYFLLLLFFWLLLKYLNNISTAKLAFLVLIVAFSTLNRESSALSISLAATLLFDKFGLRKEAIISIFALAFVFIATYLGMRLFKQNFSTNDGNLFLQNFSEPKNFLGILFWIVFFIFGISISNGRKSTRYIVIFHLLSLPYIFMCFYTGILYEARLYVPLFLTSIFLSKTDMEEGLI